MKVVIRLKSNSLNNLGVNIENVHVDQVLEISPQYQLEWDREGGLREGELSPGVG